MNKKKIRTLEEFKTVHYGKKETPRRDKLEKGYLKFRSGVDSYHKYKNVSASNIRDTVSEISK